MYWALICEFDMVYDWREWIFNASHVQGASMHTYLLMARVGGIFVYLLLPLCDFTLIGDLTSGASVNLVDFFCNKG
jgi:hypothetical protein